MIGIPLPHLHREREPREQPAPCWRCGLYRGQPRTLTWNLSGLCDGHEAAQAALEAEDRLVDDGYGRAIAHQIVGRFGGAR